MDKPDNRDGSGKFKPGASGNPGGKNKQKEELRGYIGEFSREAVDCIVNLMRNGENDKIKQSSAVWLAEQHIGKALVAITGEDGGPVRIDMGMLDKLRGLVGG